MAETGRELRKVAWCYYLDCALSAATEFDCPFDDRSCATCPYRFDVYREWLYGRNS